MRTAVALSTETTIALPSKPRPTKWRTTSRAIVCSRSGRRMSATSRAKRRTSIASASSSTSALLEDLVQLLVERLVDELELGDPVLVEQRNRRAICDRVAEVVDRDVVAKLPARELLADDERRPSEDHEGRLRKRLPHVLGQHAVLRPVRLVGDDDDVAPIGEHGHLRLAPPQPA